MQKRKNNEPRPKKKCVARVSISASPNETQHCFVLGHCACIFLPDCKYAISQNWQLFDLYVCTCFWGETAANCSGHKRARTKKQGL